MLGAAVKAAAAAVDVVVRPPPGITVLAFHRVEGGTDSSVDLPLALFASQIAELVLEHDVVTIDDAVEVLTSSTRPGSDPVVVTFDDGTADFVEHALPVLVRHRVPVCLYLATRFVDEQAPFAGAPPLSWAALRDALATGLVTVGSHTHSHLVLRAVDEADAGADLDRSVDVITTNLGVAPAHFAYPRAVPPSPGAATAVAARFRTAALSGCRPNPYGATDLHRLHRSPVQRTDGLHWFRRKAAGGMRLEGSLRAAANRRYATS